MSIFDLKLSLDRAETRFKPLREESRRVRKDAGEIRVDPRVLTELRRLLSGHEKAKMRTVLHALQGFCKTHGLLCPARASCYKLLDILTLEPIPMSTLPLDVREALYNLDPQAAVPPHQLAFYCFNYGNLRAAMFAATLPWLALHQAGKLRGWRKKSRGLLTATTHVRNL